MGGKEVVRMAETVCVMCKEEQLGPEALAEGWCVRCIAAWVVRQKARRKVYDRQRAAVRNAAQKRRKAVRRALLSRALGEEEGKREE